MLPQENLLRRSSILQYIPLNNHKRDKTKMYIGYTQYSIENIVNREMGYIIWKKN